MLAATAIVQGATLVTVNGDDFLRIHAEFPLPSLYEPFAMKWLAGGSKHKHGM